MTDDAKLPEEGERLTFGEHYLSGKDAKASPAWARLTIPKEPLPEYRAIIEDATAAKKEEG